MVSRLTDEETARRVQWLIQYDPQPPFGGIDYKHMKLLPRLFRGIERWLPFDDQNGAHVMTHNLDLSLILEYSLS
jgi:hypothetical protein